MKQLRHHSTKLFGSFFAFPFASLFNLHKVFRSTHLLLLSLFIATFSLVSCGSDFDKVYEDYLIRHVVYKAGDCTGDFAVNNLPQDETEYVLADKPILKAQPTCSDGKTAKTFTAWQVSGSDSDGEYQAGASVSFNRPDEGFTATALWGSVKPPKPAKPPIPMVTVPTNGSTPITFPMNDSNNSNGMDDATGTIKHKFAMSQTEVTYELWKKVCDWATKKGYNFQNPGTKGGMYDGTNWIGNLAGSDKQPVTNVSWRDAIVWCNAYTEWYNAEKGGSLTVVYKNITNNKVLKDSRNANATNVDSTVQTTGATGFRLPTKAEWEFAARLRKDATNTVGNNTPSGVTYPLSIGGTSYWFTKGNSASGATADYNDATETGKFAWYKDNSCDDGTGCAHNNTGTKQSKTHDVGTTKSPNALGIYDMSGNVWEWCFDIDSGSSRLFRGGGWLSSADLLQVGYVYYYSPNHALSNLGFRVARTVP